MAPDGPYECDFVGCGALRRSVNHWFVVVEDLCGVHIYRWDKCPTGEIEKGKRFCGLSHAMMYASKILTPDSTNESRESTLELKPPLSRDGTVPTNEETRKEEGSDESKQ